MFRPEDLESLSVDELVNHYDATLVNIVETTLLCSKRASGCDQIQPGITMIYMTPNKEDEGVNVHGGNPSWKFISKCFVNNASW